MTNDELLEMRRLDKLAREAPDEVGADVPLDLVIRRIEAAFDAVVATAVELEGCAVWVSDRRLDREEARIGKMRQRALDRLRRALEARR